jgi:hypothetical protein
LKSGGVFSNLQLNPVDLKKEIGHRPFAILNLLPEMTQKYKHSYRVQNYTKKVGLSTLIYVK